MTLWNARSAVKAGTLKIYKDLVSWLFNFCTLLMLGSVIRMWSHWIEKLPDRPPIAAVDTANYKANYDRLMPALDLSLGHGVIGRATDVLHVLAVESFRQVRRDVAGAVVGGRLGR